MAEDKMEITTQAETVTPQIPQVLAILPLRNMVAYPLMAVPISVGRPSSIKLVDEAALGERLIGLATMRDGSIETPTPENLYRVGTAARIHRMIKQPDGTIQMVVEGLERIRIQEFTQTEPYFKARVQTAPDAVEEGVELQAMMRQTTELFRRLVSLAPHLPEELLVAVENIQSPRQLIYLVATSIRMEVAQAQEILELDAVAEKFRRLIALLSRELEVLELGKKIQTEAQEEMGKLQRDYFLREQLKAIRKELGEEDEQAAEVKELAERIAKAELPPEAQKEAERELERLRNLPPAAAEYSVIRTYLEMLASLPWNKTSEDNLDIEHARKVLDEDHYDLEKVKERILEYLAVRKLRLERGGKEAASESKGAILCFVGPPGTGKTSLGRSIARALGRKFIRMSLGGIHDEAEIRGHRRTYIGAMPGRIIQALRRVETKNPVFMLDEIDKIGADFRGDPSSALLEVLDPQQNFEFREHYLDVPFDLSQVMFITTANLLDPISPPLRDRMETLSLAGYTDDEKVKIAQGFLIPRQVGENSLKPGEVEFQEGALGAIIRFYTREAGVRNLERQIGSVCRKVATRVAEGKREQVVITADTVAEYLGKPLFFAEAVERTQVPGVATGLAVTSTGGDILFVEATQMPGEKGLIVTGQLGEVMKESAQAALSYVRANAQKFGIPPDFYQKVDIHLHVPAGGIPKDGPSAGITMAAALASLLSGRSVRPDTGMTGEITLRGRVLPVGGIKEKVLAAHRSGLTTVILPRHNEKDLDDLPADIRSQMKFILVDWVDEAIRNALADGSLEKEKEDELPSGDTDGQRP